MIYLDFLSVFQHSSFNCVSLQSKITKTILIKIINTPEPDDSNFSIMEIYDLIGKRIISY
jgi:hypothetical protein